MKVAVDDTARRSKTPLDLQCFSQSIQGRRIRNEDNYLVISNRQAHFLEQEKSAGQYLHWWPSEYARFAVADGMGGHRKGRAVSTAAVKELLTMPPAHSLVELRELVLELHARLYKRFFDYSDRSPGTTLVIADLCLRTGRIFLANIGDSRAYSIMNDGTTCLLTHDHTIAEFESRDDGISSAGRRKKKIDSQIAQALGNGSFGVIKSADGSRPLKESPEIKIDLPEELPGGRFTRGDVQEIFIESGQTMMLASDGLWGGEAAGIWPGPCTENPLSRVELDAQVRRALAMGSGDNITILFFGFTSSPRRR